MDPEKIIEGAAKIILQPSKRTTGTYARNKVGDPVKPTSRKAVKWDAIGAMFKVARVDVDKPEKWPRSIYKALCAFDYQAVKRKGMTSIRLSDEAEADDIREVLGRAYLTCRDEMQEEDAFGQKVLAE